MIVDTEAPMRFLRTAYEPDDWIARLPEVVRDRPDAAARRPARRCSFEPKVHAWLRAMNAQRFNVYVSVNAVREGQRTRTKDAIAAVRHIFLEADEDGPERPGDDLGARGLAAAVVRPGVLAGATALLLARRRILDGRRRAAPEAPGARARNRSGGDVLLADHADRRGIRTTSGRRRTWSLFEYAISGAAFTPAVVPAAASTEPPVRRPTPRLVSRTTSMDVVERARRYLSASSRRSPGSTATCTRSRCAAESCVGSRSAMRKR